MALSVQSQYYITTAYYFCQVDYPVINTTASNLLNNIAFRWVDYAEALTLGCRCSNVALALDPVKSGLGGGVRRDIITMEAMSSWTCHDIGNNERWL